MGKHHTNQWKIQFVISVPLPIKTNRLPKYNAPCVRLCASPRVDAYQKALNQWIPFYLPIHGYDKHAAQPCHSIVAIDAPFHAPKLPAYQSQVIPQNIQDLTQFHRYINPYQK